MKMVNGLDDLGVLEKRRTKYLAERPIVGQVMYLGVEPVVVLGSDDFEFTVEIRSAGGVTDTVYIEELARDNPA